MGADEVVDSPRDFVARHIRRYVESGGRETEVARGLEMLLLTTRGRRSGKRRRTALVYGQDDGRYVLVASDGGAPRHPSWYLNLVADGQVEVQVGPETFLARARPATAAEKPRLWHLMTSLWPDYDSYQAKAAREIPLVVVEPLPER
ncbi:nitroreductase family deazaflavin-dependent oxidoreductase [Actinokineospora iranica]|uniref:Deazaflavin-dependent oxidoreductase, nitroreductase family n=1 Tax=Actinokineospora iranica TaxID=1271860 RepID=A0A1G6ITE6_9PSEU|nr:nitroreductase family deazaflavin-dependent oxidoreductase [Actinokineospora iranica]SDC09738.1 deazaflavin-dependent oxidoreductase, nitroreductase family [Actinokineospora iranica]